MGGGRLGRRWNGGKDEDVKETAEAEVGSLDEGQPVVVAARVQQFHIHLAAVVRQ